MEKRMHPQVQQWGNYLKRRLISSRIYGILYCLMCAVALVGFYFNEHFTILNEWMCAILIFFSIGGIFLQNSNIQEIKRGRKAQVINIVISILCFATVVVLSTLGVINNYVGL